MINKKSSFLSLDRRRVLLNILIIVCISAFISQVFLKREPIVTHIAILLVEKGHIKVAEDIVRFVSFSNYFFKRELLATHIATKLVDKDLSKAAEEILKSASINNYREKLFKIKLLAQLCANDYQTALKRPFSVLRKI